MAVGGGNGGGGGGAKDVRAGGAFYELWGKDGLTGVLDKVKVKALAFASFMQRVGNRASIAGAALAAPLVALFKGGVDRAADTARLAAQLNVPINLMSKLQYAAEAAGVSVQEVMEDTSGKYQGYIARAPGLDPETAKAAAEGQLQLKDATQAMQNALLPLLSTVTPYVKLVTEWVKENSGLLRVLVPVAGGLIAFGLAAKLAALGIGAAVSVALLLKAVVLALVSPLGIATAAVAGLGYLFVTQTEAGRGFAGFLKNGFVTALDVAKEAWGGIVAALGKGDLETAGKIAGAGLELVWRELMLTLQTAWFGFKGVFVDGWVEMVAAVKTVWAEFTGFIVKSFWAAISFVLNKAGVLAAGIGAEGLAKNLKDISDFADKESSAAEERRKAKVGEIEGEKTRELEARRKGRGEELMKAFAARATAAERLSELVAGAKAGPEGEGGFGKGIGAGLDKARMLAGLMGATEVKGSFSGAALGQQFNVGSEVQKQTELLKQLLGGEGDLPRKIGEETSKGLAANLKIK